MDSVSVVESPQTPDQPVYELQLTEVEKKTAMLCHLLGLAAVTGIPFANVIGPLIPWLIKKETSAFVDDQGREAVNFQITVTIAMFACIPLVFVIIGLILLPIIAIAALIFTIVGAVTAAGGNFYRYPMTFRLIK